MHRNAERARGLVARTVVLRNQRRSRDREADAQCDRQKHDRRGDRHCRNRRGAQSANPECIDQLIRRLQHVCDRNRQCELQQRRVYRALEKRVSFSVIALRIWRDAFRPHTRCSTAICDDAAAMTIDGPAHVFYT